MDTSLRLLLGFLVGGVWVAATTAAAERYGSRLGGFIGGIPSTLAVALLFIAIAGGREAAIQASRIAPLAFAVNGLYVLLFAALSRGMGFYPAMAVALAVWAVAQTGLVWLGAPTLSVILSAWGLSFAVCLLGFRRWLKIQPQASRGLPAGPAVLALRAVASGALVAAAATSSLWWGPVAGGVMASLPVVFISTLFIAYRRMGLAFAQALAQSLVFSAVVNCTVFALAFHWTLGRMGLLPAFAAAYAVTLLAAFPLYRLRLG